MAVIRVSSPKLQKQPPLAVVVSSYGDCFGLCEQVLRYVSEIQVSMEFSCALKNSIYL